MDACGAIGFDGNGTITGSSFTNNQGGHIDPQGSPYFCGAIGNGGTLTITASTFTHNNVTGGGGIRRGGAIYNEQGKSLTVTDSTFSGNEGSDGGAVYSEGSFTATNDTFSGNSAGLGGAISNEGSLAVIASTISGNSAYNGGGVFNDTNRIMTLSLSLLAGNTLTSTSSGPDLFGAVYRDDGGNVVGITDGSTGLTNPSDRLGTAASPLNPHLGPLADHGGPVQTFSLLPPSPAIDIAACPAALTTDARGIARPQPVGGKCDAGAFEYRGATSLTKRGDGQGTSPNSYFAVPLGVRLGADDPTPPGSGTAITFTITPGAGGARAIFSAAHANGCTVAGDRGSASCVVGSDGSAGAPALYAQGVVGAFTLKVSQPQGQPMPKAGGTPMGPPVMDTPIPQPATVVPPASAGTPLPQPTRH